MIFQKPIFIIIYIVIFLFFLLAVYAVYLYFNQSKYVYFPTADIVATPSDMGLYYRDLMLETNDGIKISAWYIPAENTEATILFFHGNGGNISHRLEFIEMFYSLGISTLIIDYRGYGKSEGFPTEKGTYLDSEAAWNYLVKEKNNEPSSIIIYGRSLGGPVAARLAEKHHPGALILDSTFTSLKDIGAKLYPYLPVRKFLKFNYETIAHLKETDFPVLIIHSVEDDYIPFHHAEKLFDRIDGQKKLVSTSGGHNTNFTISRNAYKNNISDLLKSIF
jgi:pimeloyl-ACP methyl ester carboxylesterase